MLIILIIFAILGICVFLYGCFYLIAICLFDCDIQLAFYSKFGKSPRSLKGKVVFITGASSGIGEYIALALAKNGVKLVLAARRKTELERVKKKCIAISKELLSDNDIYILEMDMTDLESHEKYFNSALQHFGSIDILINNAGRTQRAFWENIEIAVDKQMFEVNVFGVVHLSRIALNYFLKSGHGQIAVVSSLAARFAIPYCGSYNGSKFAIQGYFNALRTEMLGKNISITLLCPGPTYTNFLSESFTERDGQKYGLPANPNDRRMTAERCGELCSIAITNKLRESWIGIFPNVLFVYCAVYFPLISDLILDILGPEKLFKVPDRNQLQRSTSEVLQ